MKATHVIKINGKFYYAGEEIPVFDEEAGDCDNVAVVDVPKRRGRPPKAGVENEHTGNTEASPS